MSALTLLLPAIAAPALAHADTIQTGVCTGANLQLSGSDCSSTAGADSSLHNIITLVINIFSVIVGIIAVIMIIVGGIRFVLSGGDSSATGSARNTVIYAIVGLVIVFVAQILVRFVLNRVNSAAGTGG